MPPTDGHLDDTRPAAPAPPGLPAFLTVEETADLLRIGRTTAYGLTRQWRATNGQTGLPVVKVGHKLRVPLHQLEALAGGPLDQVPTDAVSPPAEVAAPTTPAPPSRPAPDDTDTDSVSSPTPAPPTRRSRRAPSAGQASLFGDAS